MRCSYEDEKCITGEKSGIVVFEVYDNEDKTIVKFYNPLVDALFPPIDINASGNFSLFLKYFPLEEKKLELNNDQSNDSTD